MLPALSWRSVVGVGAFPFLLCVSESKLYGATASVTARLTEHVTVVAAPTASAPFSLHDAIVAAWLFDPEQGAYMADSTSAQRRASAARSWFSGGPTVAGQYYDDHFIGSKVGYTTYQGSISVPFWLPGQGTATENAAKADEKVANWQMQVQRLAVAARVVDLAGQGAVLSARLNNLSAVSHVLEQTTQDVEHAWTAGEVSGADREAAVAEKADVDGTLADMGQQLEGVRAELEALTGRDNLPDLGSIDGRRLARDGYQLDVEQDPRIKLADAQLKKAQASYSVARHSYMPNPQVGVMLSRQEQYESPWDTQVGVQFQVGLPSEAVNTPLVMKEMQAVSRAEADKVLAHRKVMAEYRQLRAQLAAAATQVRHARLGQEQSDLRASDLSRAWKAGELPLVEYLRARRTALDAADRQAQAEATMRTTIARIILMTGQTP
nr:TolC family protein [Acetobacter suratthaniensis]